MEDLIHQCKIFLKEGRLKKALEILCKIDDSYGSTLLFRFNENERKYHKSLVTDNEHGVEKSRIHDAANYKLENPEAPIDDIYDYSNNRSHNAGGDQNIFNFSDQTDNIANYNCPYPNCNTSPAKDQITKSEIICGNCNSKYFIYNPNYRATTFKTLSTEKGDDYRGLIFQIEAAIDMENYEKADDLCEQAIKTGPEESIAWEYKALIYYFSNSKNQIIADELNTIKKYLNIANRAPGESSSIEMIAGRILYHLDFSIKHRVQTIWNNLDEPENRVFLKKLFNNWYVSYGISKDPYFLKNIIEKLALDKKLIKKGVNGQLTNAYEDFNALEMWNSFLPEIRKTDNSYTPPDIAYKDTTTAILAKIRLQLKDWFQKLVDYIKNKIAGK